MIWCIFIPYSLSDWLIARQFSFSLHYYPFRLVSMIFWQPVRSSIRISLLKCEPCDMAIIFFLFHFLMCAVSYMSLCADWFACQQFIKINLIVNVCSLFEVNFWPIKGFCCWFSFLHNILSLKSDPLRQIIKWFFLCLFVFVCWFFTT